MGLLTVLVGGALLAGMALSLALMGAGESTLAMHDRDVRSAAYAARGAASLAIAELRQRGDWSTMLTAGGDPSVSAAPSRLMDVSLTPSAPWGGTLDLRALTAAVQADTDGAPGPGDAIVWRLFLASPLDRVLRPRPTTVCIWWPGSPTTGPTGTATHPPISITSSWFTPRRSGRAACGRLWMSRLRTRLVAASPT